MTIDATPVPVDGIDPDVAAVLDAHRVCCHWVVINALERLEFIARLNGTLLIKYRDRVGELERVLGRMKRGSR